MGAYALHFACSSIHPSQLIELKDRGTYWDGWMDMNRKVCAKRQSLDFFFFLAASHYYVVGGEEKEMRYAPKD